MPEGINLAPGTEYIALAKKRKRRVYGIAFIIVVVGVAIAGGLFLIRQGLIQEKRDIENRISAIEAEITRLGDEATRVKLFEERLVSVDDLLTNHIAWDPLLTDLERLLPPPTIMNQVNVDVAEASVGISGETPNIDEVAQTLASLVTRPGRETIFTSATVENVNRTQVDSPEGEVLSITYEFSADLSFDANALTNGQ